MLWTLLDIALQLNRQPTLHFSLALWCYCVRACVRVRIYRVFVLRSECLSSFDFVILLFKALTMCLMNSMIVHTASTKFVIIAGTAYWIKLTKQKGNKRQKRKKKKLWIKSSHIARIINIRYCIGSRRGRVAKNFKRKRATGGESLNERKNRVKNHA